MATDLVNSGNTLDTTKDNVIIVNLIETLPGGRSLNVDGFTPTEISAGHVITKDEDNNFYPLPTTGSLPSGHSYAGILVASIKTSKPMAAIMTRGTVNEAYYSGTYAAAVKSALSLIHFINQ